MNGFQKERHYQLGTLSPNPWDLSPCARMADWLVGRLRAAPSHSGRWVGAPVASLRCRILRPGEVSISPAGIAFQKSICLRDLQQGINTLVLVLLRWPVLKCPPMAGFQMSTEAFMYS